MSDEQPEMSRRPEILSLLGYVDAEDFGAVSDGVTDDMEALNAALNYAVKIGAPGVVIRNHKIGRTIEIPSEPEKPTPSP